MSVMAPRDFDQCAKPREDFFPATLAAAYVFNGLPALPIYLANSKPDKFVRSVLRIKGLRRNEMLMDDYELHTEHTTKHPHHKDKDKKKKKHHGDH